MVHELPDSGLQMVPAHPLPAPSFSGGACSWKSSEPARSEGDDDDDDDDDEDDSDSSSSHLDAT